MKPSLTLGYSSSGSNGLYGVGWSVSGLSSISRCYKTVAQDSVDGTPDLATTDRFCIDGNRLRSFSGTYGADGAQYQTEIADFSLIISHGTAGVGPAWFEVYAKNGLIYEYGNTAHSALLAAGSTTVITYALNKIRDRVGNHVDFDYTNDATNHVIRPLTITYTTSPGTTATPQYQVSFGTETRPDPMNWYFAGTLSQESNRINQISISAWNGSSYALARAYYLSYSTGITGYSRMTSISECSPTQCFPATTIAYQNGTGGWNSAVAISGVPSTASIIARMDLNGDGIDDIVYASSGAVYYLIGQSSGTFLGPYSAGANCSVGSTYLPLDFYGNKKIALLEKNSSNNWRVCALSTIGSAFAYVDTTTPVVAGTIAGDVDGDGYQDLIYIGTSGGWSNISYVRNLGNGTGFAASTKLYQGAVGETFTTLLVPNTGASVSKRIDFNGDGRDDFMFFVDFCTTDTGKGCTGTQWQYYWTTLISKSDGTYVNGDDLITSPSAMTPIFGDFNGDGCTDVALSTTFGTGGDINIYYGACDGQAYTAFSGGAQTSFPIATYTKALAADWDGDGRADLLLYNSSTSTWGYAVSTGSGFGAWTSLGIASLGVVGDFNGDGLPDLAGGSGGISYWGHAGVASDLATSFTDGFGVNYSPTYATLSNTSSYTEASGATYPERDFKGAVWVVPSYTATDGVGGTYTITEAYYGARVNVQGRGFEGFLWKEANDSRSGLYLKESFALTFPTTGILTERTMYQSNGTTPISDVVNTVPAGGYVLDNTVNNQRYFPYTSQSVSTQYEVNGALNGSPITQKTTAISYAGTNGFTYGNPSQITSTTIDEDTTSPWHGNTFTDQVSITPHEDHSAVPTGWCIGLTDQATDKRTQPSGANITHTQSYTVTTDGTCRVTGQTIEPSSSTDKVATTYGYTDGCNNVNSISVTGQNPDGTAMGARTTSIGYGTRCIAPESVNNALNLNQITTIGYRYDLGLPTSVTDPNALTASITYSDLGQKTLEQRPDGTETSYSYAACSSPSYCGDSNLRYSMQRSELDATGSHSSFWSTTQLFDAFGRLKYDEPMQSNGASITRFVSYDNRGRVVGRTNPYGNGFSSYTTTIVYDAVNRVTQEYRPISSTNSTLEYTNYSYQGRTHTVTDPRSNLTKKQFDVVGELSILTDPDGVSQTNYSYDPFGNLTSISDPASNHTTRTFDALGYLLTGSSDPDRGAWTYQYDSLGELKNLRDAKTTAPAWTQQLTYDALGRTLTRVEAEGTTTWTWGTVAANHEIGKLTQLSGLGDTEAYTFDAYGRSATHTQTWNSNSYQISYAYNTLGKLDTLTYPSTPLSGNRFQVKYGYTDGYLSSLQNYTGGTAGTTFWQLTPGVANMDPWGHVVDETLRTTTAVRIQSAFDAVTSWLNTRQVGSGGSSNNLQSLAYQWDTVGNLSQRQDLKQSLTEAFTNDSLNRLQSSTLNGTTNISVVVDATGNITSRTEGGVTYPYTYDTTHKHAVATVGTGGNQTTYSYDANGNMSTRNGYSVSWSTANLPTSIAAPSGVSAAFSYGPDRQRKQQTSVYTTDGDSGTETTIYVAGLFEIETTPAQTHYKHFVQVPGGTQIVYDLQSVSGAQTTFVTADHLGSGNLLINSAGTMLVNESFSAYGYRRSSNWAGPLSAGSGDYGTIASTTRRGYTSAFHEMLDNVGLIHMNGRVYDPAIGRFLSADPRPGKVGASQSWNPYAYVMGAPTRWTDPTGLETNEEDVHVNYENGDMAPETDPGQSAQGQHGQSQDSQNQDNQNQGNQSQDNQNQNNAQNTQQNIPCATQPTACNIHFDEPQNNNPPSSQPPTGTATPSMQVGGGGTGGAGGAGGGGGAAGHGGTTTSSNSKPQAKPPSKACQLAAALAEAPNAVNQAANNVGNGIASEDAALQAMAGLAPSLPNDLRAGGVALGQLAESGSRVVGPAGYVVGGAQVAYNTYQGYATGNSSYYGEAAFGTADLGIQGTLAVFGGPVGVGVALAWGYVGGSKAVVGAGATAACAMGF